MKQLLILSGKGGTGKTTIASAMIELAKAKACADCDVDAPNLHLVLNYDGEPVRSDYYGLQKAFVDHDVCTMCGLCAEKCRFDAITIGDIVNISPYACEGCAVCELVCPVDAIEMRATVAGDLYLYSDPKKGIFSTAQLRMGNGTSGLLVTEVKKQMKKAAKDAPLAIIDGSPGIGCPVLASITGVDMILIVAEPSVSGISDMERILDTAAGLGARSILCVNKADTNLSMTRQIKDHCIRKNIPYVGEMPYDPEVVKIVNRGETLADAKSPAGDAVRSIFKKVMDVMNGKAI
jgi:MinD superfamily P-loop ATPase